MATTIAPGNWSDDAIWDTTAPGVGEVAVLDHFIVADQNLEVGTSPATESGTFAITIGAAGRLEIAQNVKVTCRGDINVLGAFANDTDCIVLQDGAHLEGDTTLATDPTNQEYGIRWDVRNNTGRSVVANGTSGNRCTISSNAAGGNFYMFPGGTGDGRLQVEYCDFIRMGSATRDAIWSKLATGTTVEPYTYYVRNCTFTDCGRYYFTGGLNGDDILEIADTKFSGGTGAHDLYLNTTGEDVTTGTRQMLRCSFEQETYFLNAFGFTVDSCMFNDRAIMTDLIGGTVKNSLILIRVGADSTNLWAASVQKNILVEDRPIVNTHGWSMSAEEPATWSDNILEAQGDGAGDYVFPDTNIGVMQHAITGMLVLPNSRGACSGSWFAWLVNEPLMQVSVEHCTYFTGDNNETGVKVGESYAGHAGMISSLKSNIAWNSSPGNGLAFKYVRMAASAIQDTVNAADADYNCGFNLDTGELKGYQNVDKQNSLWSSGTGGANDIDADPQFTDVSRCMALYDTATSGLNNPLGTTWDGASHSYSIGDVASATTVGIYGGVAVNYRCINPHVSATGDPTNGIPGDEANTTSWRTNWELNTYYLLRESPSLISGCYDWVWAGFAPTNATLAGAAHDGGDIGAVPVDAGITTTVTATNTEGSDAETFTWTEVSPP